MKSFFTVLATVVMGVSIVGSAYAGPKHSGGRAVKSARASKVGGYRKGFKRSGRWYGNGYGKRSNGSAKFKTSYKRFGRRGWARGYNCGLKSQWTPSYGCNSGWCPPCQGDGCYDSDDGCDQSSGWSCSDDDSDGCDGYGADDGCDQDQPSDDE